MRNLNAMAVAMFALLVASNASAALSPQYEEWRNGPVQWIMTGAEKREWKRVSSDEAAIAFIDLFWARRDPTAGTPQNEARDDHDARVNYADENFSERRYRGSLTDRGRVLIALGPPPNIDMVHGRIANAADAMVTSETNTAAGAVDGGPGLDPSRGRKMGARDIWVWEHDAAASQFDMPRVEVVFITDPVTAHTIRDVFRRDFMAAEQAALKKQIQGDYDELPEWAAFGGLVPHTRVTRAAAPQVIPAPGQRPPSAVVPSAPRGATRLTLTRSVFSIDTNLPGDPFATLAIADRFKTSEELGWVAQYCGQGEGEPSVPFLVRISGGPHAVDRATPPEEVVPDKIKSSPGCFLLRGAIPLDDMAPGRYTLHLLVDDPIVKTNTYEMNTEFTVE